MNLFKESFEEIKEFLTDVNEQATYKLLISWFLGVFIASNIYALLTIIQWVMK